MLVTLGGLADPDAGRHHRPGSHIGCSTPNVPRTRGWRRIGTAIVRWPGPVLVTSIAVALIGLLALPGLQDQLRRPALHAGLGASQGGLRGGRTALLGGPTQPEVLMVEIDKDLRTRPT